MSRVHHRKGRFGVTLVYSVAAGLLLGCAAPRQRAGSEVVAWTKLRRGMSYEEVARLIAPFDPELKTDLREIRQQEREALKDFQADMAALGPWAPSSPVLNSEFTIDRGDYLLLFRNGNLADWRRF